MMTVKKNRSFILKIAMIAFASGSYLPLTCKAQPVEKPSPIIQQDIKDQKYVSDDNKPLEKYKRDKVEETQNKGINAGLYLQGLPTIKTDNGDEYDPYFILHNHYDAKDTTGTQYCDASAQNEAGFACQSDPLLAHGDIKISTLLSGALLDEARAAAVRWFIQNLIDPAPNAILKNPDAVRAYLNDPNKQPELAKALATQAILSVARQPFAEMVAKRSAEPGGGMSVMQKMEQEASQKYLNATWQQAQKKGYEAQLAKKSGLEPLYDIAVMTAYHNWLALERYKQGERIEALLAAIVVELGAGAKIGQGVITQTTTSPMTNIAPPPPPTESTP